MVRRQHNSGFKHKSNVKAYYFQYEDDAQMRLMAEAEGYDMVSGACERGRERGGIGFDRD